MEARLYKLKSGFAEHNNLLIYFSAIPLMETQKAVYLYGHGTTETTKMGVCCCCGRALTHPVSVELGIGPECGQHFHDWDRIGGYTKENLERLKGEMVKVVFDHWVPKSQIEETFATTDTVIVPKDHPKLVQQIKDKIDEAFSPTKFTKYVEMIEGSQSYALQVLKVTFPFNFEDIDRVKTLIDRRYIASMKCWTCKIDIHNIAKLKAWGFTLSDSVDDILRRRDASVGGDVEITVNTVKPIKVPGLKKKLFPFQEIGVGFIEEKNGRALIADEMGLGKTVQALAWLQLHPELKPVVIVVPASLKLNWLQEAHKWMTDRKVTILSGKTSYPLSTKSDILVINYDVLSSWVDALIKVVPKVLIMDEIHAIKNSTTKRTKAVKKLAKGITHVIGLSGTPIVNRPIEAYNALTIINSAAIPNFKQYTKRFCAAKYNGYGWDFTGASNTDELHKLLVHAFMIRRKKSDVLKDLPDKLKSFVPMELDNQDVYDDAEADFIAYLKATKGKAAADKAAGAEALTKIETLKQLAVQGKMKQVIDWVDNFLDSDQKLVLFGVHKSAIDIIMREFGSLAVKIDGSVSMNERNKAVERFQSDPNIRLFVGNIQAAGVGLTLTTASNVAFMELPWTPGALVQAEDRCHRIGQKDSVTIHYLLAAGTIEEKIALLLDGKRKILDAVLDGEKTSEKSLLSELMKSYI